MNDRKSHVALYSASPAWEGATELLDRTPGAAAPTEVPEPVRHVSARCVAFRSPHAGDESRFLLEEWTTEFDDGTSSRDYVWVRGQYVLVVPIWNREVVFIRQYKKAAERTLLVLPWSGIEGDESPLDAGRRELEEESARQRSMDPFMTFQTNPPEDIGWLWLGTRIARPILLRMTANASTGSSSSPSANSGGTVFPCSCTWVLCAWPGSEHRTHDYGSVNPGSNPAAVRAG